MSLVYLFLLSANISKSPSTAPSSQLPFFQFFPLLMCLTALSFTAVCCVKSLPCCGRSLWRGKEKREVKKRTEEWFVVPGSCSLGKCNGQWLFKVSPICHKCSLQMDTYNNSPPGRGAAACQRSRRHLSTWMTTSACYCMCARVQQRVRLTRCDYTYTQQCLRVCVCVCTSV